MTWFVNLFLIANHGASCAIDAELMYCKTGPGACVPARPSTLISVAEKHPELMYAGIGKTSKDGKLGEVDTTFKMISDSNWIPPPCYVFPQKSIGKSKRGFNGELLSCYPLAQIL